MRRTRMDQGRLAVDSRPCARAAKPEPRLVRFPVMRRIAITTPNVMAALRRLNRDQARPYNFALSPVIVNVSGFPITLLGPFEKNSARWQEMPYINIHDGSTQTLKPPTIPVLAQTFETVFSQYVRHPELQERRTRWHSLQG